MNNEQLQDWLTELNTQWKDNDIKTEMWRTSLNALIPNAQILNNYLICNFENLNLSQPLIAQLLALYYRLGNARHFVLQFIPTLINCYLISLSKRWRNCVDSFEMFFLAIYNEEILIGGTGSESMAKKIEEIRIPTVRYSNQDMTKQTLAELKLNNPKLELQSTIRVGPYPALDRIIAENRYSILTRLMRSVR